MSKLECHYCQENINEAIFQSCSHIACSLCNSEVEQEGGCPLCPPEYREQPILPESEDQALADSLDESGKKPREIKKKIQQKIDQGKAAIQNEVIKLKELRKQVQHTIAESTKRIDHPEDFKEIIKTLELQEDRLRALVDYYQNSFEILEANCLNWSDRFYLIRVLEARLAGVKEFLKDFQFLSVEEIFSKPADADHSLLFFIWGLRGVINYLVLFDKDGNRSLRNNTVLICDEAGRRLGEVPTLLLPGVYSFPSQITEVYNNVVLVDGKMVQINGEFKIQFMRGYPNSIAYIAPTPTGSIGTTPGMFHFLYDQNLRELRKISFPKKEKKEEFFPGDRSGIPLGSKRLPNSSAAFLRMLGEPDQIRIMFASERFIYTVEETRDWTYSPVRSFNIYHFEPPHRLEAEILCDAEFPEVPLPVGVNSFTLRSYAASVEEFLKEESLRANRGTISYFKIEFFEPKDSRKKIEYQVTKLPKAPETIFYGIKLSDDYTGLTGYATVFPDGRFFYQNRQLLY